MTDDTRKPAGAKSDKPKPNEKKKHMSELLDEGLEESFPASDTPAVVRPGHALPPNDTDKD